MRRNSGEPALRALGAQLFDEVALEHDRGGHGRTLLGADYPNSDVVPETVLLELAQRRVPLARGVLYIARDFVGRIPRLGG
jgi:hypothetical protein